MFLSNKIKNSLYVLLAYFISIIISLINTLYLSRNLDPKEFAIFGSLISISLVISGIFSFSQSRFLTEGVKIKRLEEFSINVVSISLLPLLIFLLSFNIFGDELVNSNIKDFLILISVLITSNLIKIFFLNYERIRNNYKNYFYYYIYDKIILFLSLVIFIFTGHFEIFIKIYCLLNIVIILNYFVKFKKINFKFLNDLELIKSSTYKFFLNIVDYLISIHILIFVMMNIGEFNISSSITLGLTIYSLMMIPLAILETFLGPIIARIFKQKDKELFFRFINKNLINFYYFLFFAFFIFKIIIFKFNILEILFPKYTDYKLIIFSVSYLTFYSFIKLYFYWFFMAMNKVEIILKNTIYHSIIVVFLFFYFYSNLNLFIYFFILSFLLFSILVTYSFNLQKRNKSFLKVIIINLIVIFDFTIFYLFEDLQIYSNIFNSIFLFIFYFYHKEIKIFILELSKIKLGNK